MAYLFAFLSILVYNQGRCGGNKPEQARSLKMTQQATAILLDWGHEHSIEEQEKFSVYFGKLMDEHYYPKQVLVTGRTMEAIIENYEAEKE